MAVVVAAAAAVESEEVWSAVGGDVNGRCRCCRGGRGDPGLGSHQKVTMRLGSSSDHHWREGSLLIHDDLPDPGGIQCWMVCSTEYGHLWGQLLSWMRDQVLLPVLKQDTVRCLSEHPVRVPPAEEFFLQLQHCQCKDLLI